MKLDTFVQSKVRWHLGYNLTSVPAGDQARLEEAMNNVQDSFWYDKIVEQITRCEEAEKRTDMTGSVNNDTTCLLYTSPSPRDVEESRMPSSA